MNISAKTLVIVLLAAALPLASAVSHAQGSLTISCARHHLPSQQAVGKLLGLDNFGQVYHARARLLQDVQRTCRSGVAQVTVSDDTSMDLASRWPQDEPRAAVATYAADATLAH